MPVCKYRTPLLNGGLRLYGYGFRVVCYFLVNIFSEGTFYRSISNSEIQYCKVAW